MRLQTLNREVRWRDAASYDGSPGALSRPIRLQSRERNLVCQNGKWHGAAMTHGELIKKLGGPRAVAALLNLTEKAPCKWHARGIPAVHWLPIVRVAKEKGIVKPDGRPIEAEDLERTAADYPLTREQKARPASSPSPTRNTPAARPPA